MGIFSKPEVLFRALKHNFMLRPVILTSPILVSCSPIKLLQFHLKGLRPEPVQTLKAVKSPNCLFLPPAHRSWHFQPGSLSASVGEGKFPFQLFQEVTFTQESFKPQSHQHRLSSLRNLIISPQNNFASRALFPWKGMFQGAFQSPRQFAPSTTIPAPAICAPRHGDSKAGPIAAFKTRFLSLLPEDPPKIQNFNYP